MNSESVHFLSPLDHERLKRLLAQSQYHKAVTNGQRVVAFLLSFQKEAQYDSPNFLWFAGRYNSFLYIDRVVVHSDYRRKGLGELLYGDLYGYAVKSGIEYLTCEIDIEPPNPGSLRFHEKQGFVEVGTQWISNGKKQVSLREKKVVQPGRRKG